MSRRRIKGLRTILTGASMGIGRALAEELARGGARLVLGARSREALESLAAELRGRGAEAVAVPCDVTAAADRQGLLDAARKHFGGLDLLINNAGVGALGPFVQATEDRLRRIFEVNFFGLTELVRLCLPALAEGDAPMIVNVSSILGKRGFPLSSEYCASKFAVQGFSEALRAELARTGIDVLVVCPGATETPFLQNVIDKQGERPWPDRGKMSAETVARKTVAAIRRGKHEIILTAPARFLHCMNRFAPCLVDRFLARYGPPAESDDR